MMSPSSSGFFNAAETAWRWYVDDNGNSIQPGSASIQNGLNVSNAGGAYTYITLHDDESPNGVKYIHANSNAIGFLSGYGSWIANWDNAGNSWQQGNASIGGNLTVGGKNVCLQDGTNCPAAYAPPAPAPVCTVPNIPMTGCMHWTTCTGSITSSVSGSCQYNFGCANPGLGAGNDSNIALSNACSAQYGGTLAEVGYWSWTCTIGASCKGGGFDADCTANNGNPTTVPDGTRVCQFNAASCPVYYSQYQNWSTTQSVSSNFNGSPWWWYGMYNDPGCSTPAGCTTGGHTWGNAGVESCSANAYYSYLNENQPYLIDPNTGNYVFDVYGNYILNYACNYYGSATVSASRTQIGCVR